MKTKNLKFYKRNGNLIYAESSDYLIEFDFELSEIGIINIAIIASNSVSVVWKIHSKEITEKVFLKYYKIAKKLNPFTPEL